MPRATDWIGQRVTITGAVIQGGLDRSALPQWEVLAVTPYEFLLAGAAPFYVPRASVVRVDPVRQTP